MQMAAQRLNEIKNILLIFTCAFTVSCDSEERVILDNMLGQYLVFSGAELVESETLLLYSAKSKLKDNVGLCGCKSAVIAYSVHLEAGDQLVSYGVFSTLNKERYNFVIGSDKTIFKSSNFKLAITCSN
jgi:hypothetical protein